jgi:hypothetical protein
VVKSFVDSYLKNRFGDMTHLGNIPKLIADQFAALGEWPDRTLRSGDQRGHGRPNGVTRCPCHQRKKCPRRSGKPGLHGYVVSPLARIRLQFWPPSRSASSIAGPSAEPALQASSRLPPEGSATPEIGRDFRGLLQPLSEAMAPDVVTPFA